MREYTNLDLPSVQSRQKFHQLLIDIEDMELEEMLTDEIEDVRKLGRIIRRIIKKREAES